MNKYPQDRSFLARTRKTAQIVLIALSLCSGVDGITDTIRDEQSNLPDIGHNVQHVAPSDEHGVGTAAKLFVSGSLFTAAHLLGDAEEKKIELAWQAEKHAHRSEDARERLQPRYVAVQRIVPPPESPPSKSATPFDEFHRLANALNRVEDEFSALIAKVFEFETSAHVKIRQAKIIFGHGGFEILLKAYFEELHPSAKLEKLTDHLSSLVEDLLKEKFQHVAMISVEDRTNIERAMHEAVKEEFIAGPAQVLQRIRDFKAAQAAKARTSPPSSV